MAIPIYEQLATRDALLVGSLRVAFIRVPSDPPTLIPPGLFHTRLALHGALDTSHEWFATTPAAVEIVSGKVIVAAGYKAMSLAWLR